MTKRVVNIPTFSPNQTLKSIRENSLNPVIERVLTVEGSVDTLVPKLNNAYNNVTFNSDNGKLSFVRVGGGAVTDIDLSSIVPPFAGIEVMGYNATGSATLPGSGDVKHASQIKFLDADITKDTVDGFAKVVYQWDKIIPEYQSEMTVEIPTAVPNMTRGPYDHLEIIGDGAKEYFSYNQSAQVKKGKITINMPLIPKQMHAKVQETTIPSYEGSIDGIEILGNVGGSLIKDGILYVDMPSGGGPVRTTRYFEGFYNSTGDLEKAVTDPYIDRSCAYVLKEGTYVLHMYKGKDDGWQPVKTRATIIYKGDGSGTPDQGVVSIKRDDNISITSDGELDLSELGKHGGDLPVDDFKGIFDTVEEIKALTEGLVEDRSYAMLRNVKASNAFSTYFYRKETPDSEAAWNLTPNLGHLVMVEDAMQVGKYRPVYGIKAPSSSYTKKSVLDLTKGNIKGTIKATVSGRDAGGSSQTEEVRAIRYPLGAADAYITGDKTTLVVNPAQMVVDEMTDDWKAAHDSDDYIGKIYFNRKDARWYGMSHGDEVINPPKWVAIAHKHMSSQVISLNTRYPEELVPIDDKSPLEAIWGVAGSTYLSAKDSHLPKDFPDGAGGFVQTEIKMNTLFPETGPTNQIRIQICRPDDGTGGTWQRVYDKDKSEWKPWVKTSFTEQDLEDHKNDPAAHKDLLRYYRAYALQGKISTIFTQTTGESLGGFIKENSMLLADSHGYSPLEEVDYLDAPYKGLYNINGVFSFSGYKETTSGKPDKVTLGRWQLMLRKKIKDGAGWTQVAFFTYEHTDSTKPYPPLLFKVNDVELEPNQEVVMNLTFNTPLALASENPDLYLVGARSNIAIEHNKTRAGGAIVAALRKLYGNLDSVGTAGIKAHHTTESDPTSSIRIVGEASNKLATPMTKQ